MLESTISNSRWLMAAFYSDLQAGAFSFWSSRLALPGTQSITDVLPTHDA
jgi:hypothetical protein